MALWRLGGPAGGPAVHNLCSTICATPDNVTGVEKRNDPGVREHLEAARANIQHVLEHLEDSPDVADCVVEGWLLAIRHNLEHVIEERLDE